MRRQQKRFERQASRNDLCFYWCDNETYIVKPYPTSETEVYYNVKTNEFDIVIQGIHVDTRKGFNQLIQFIHTELDNTLMEVFQYE